MAIDDQFIDEKIHCDIDREAAKNISLIIRQD